MLLQYDIFLDCSPWHIIEYRKCPLVIYESELLQFLPQLVELIHNIVCLAKDC